MEQPRFKGMLESLQLQDPEITQIIVYSKFVVAYLLQQDGVNPGWRKANIEGPVYIVRRRSLPHFQLLVKNQLHMDDLLDSLHPDWELDCQKNYVFYKIQDTTKRIRGLWFHDDAERQKIEAMLEKTLQEIRKPQPQAAPQVPEPKPAAAAPPQAAPPAPMPAAEAAPVEELYAQLTRSEPADEVTVTMSSLRSALHALADDDNFLKVVMQKLKSTQGK
mmetsp:Transcript_44942/g.90672  ORF Transcript_44942/g.90672 Transcript_44942/m.90672 type:complete len:219 (+) Transcript_44942:90-746(+)